jgi:hypothetical protein
MEIKKNFVRGIMNKDLDDRLLPDSVYRDALNIKASSSDDQDSGTVQNYLGNTEMVDVARLDHRQRVFGYYKHSSNWFIYRHQE